MREEEEIKKKKEMQEKTQNEWIKKVGRPKMPWSEKVEIKKEEKKIDIPQEELDKLWYLEYFDINPQQKKK